MSSQFDSKKSEEGPDKTFLTGANVDSKEEDELDNIANS